MKYVKLFEEENYGEVMLAISHAIAPMSTLWTKGTTTNTPSVCIDAEFENWQKSKKISSAEGLQRVKRIDGELIDWEKVNQYSFYDLNIPAEILKIAEHAGLKYVESVGIYVSGTFHSKDLWIGIKFEKDELLSASHRGKISGKKFKF